MKLDEINKVKQTFDENVVNEYLAKGYRLVKVFSSKIKNEEMDEVRPCYVLGLGRE